MMARCPDCGEEYYGLHFCPCRLPGITVTSEMIKKILAWWSKKFRGKPWDNAPRNQRDDTSGS